MNKPDDGIFLHHPAKELDKVTEEMLSEYPEEAFCFLNEGRLREDVGLFRDNFLPDNQQAVVAYSIKANPKRRILEILSQEGINNFDCTSPNEISLIRRVNKRAIALYNHPIKRACDIRSAAEMGVRHFTVQTKREIKKILENAFPFQNEEEIEIAVRLQTLNEDAEINLSTKFGAIEEQAKAMIKFLCEETNTQLGIAANTGSQNKDPDTFKKAVEQISQIIKTEDQVKSINLGGGFPVNYFEEEKHDIKTYIEIINEAVKRCILNITGRNDCKIIIEPGRGIIAGAVDLVIPILAVETRDGQKCAYIHDGLFTSFSDSAIHGWKYNFKGLGKKGKNPAVSKGPYILYGRTCDSGDVLKDVILPDNLEEGDYIHVANAGAYMDCQASYFNGFETPKYVSYNRKFI